MRRLQFALPFQTTLPRGSSFGASVRLLSNYPPPGTPSSPSNSSGGDSEVGAPNPAEAAEEHTHHVAGRPDTGADVTGSPFNGTSRAAHRKISDDQSPPVLPGTGSATVFPRAHASDPIGSSVHSGVDALREQAVKAGQRVQEGTDHTKHFVDRALEQGEEVADKGASVIGGTARSIREGTSQAVHDASQMADYTSKEAQDLYNKAAHAAEETAAQVSPGGKNKFDAAEATLKDPLYQRDEREAGRTARKGAARRPGAGVEP